MYGIRQVSNVVIPSSFVNPGTLLRNVWDSPIKFDTLKEAESFVSMQGPNRTVRYEIVTVP